MHRRWEEAVLQLISHHEWVNFSVNPGSLFMILNALKCLMQSTWGRPEWSCKNRQVIISGKWFHWQEQSKLGMGMCQVVEKNLLKSLVYATRKKVHR